jgi:hypothetical protein
MHCCQRITYFIGHDNKQAILFIATIQFKAFVKTALIERPIKTIVIQSPFTYDFVTLARVDKMIHAVTSARVQIFHCGMIPQMTK